MKLKAFAILVLVAGLAFAIALTVAAQETGVRSANPHIVPAGSPVDHLIFLNATTLGHTSEITFTPAFTGYLPAVFKDIGLVQRFLPL